MATKNTKTETEVKEAPKILNIFEKLSVIRNKFLETDKKKSGKNIHAEFLYWELKDIIPVARPILKEANAEFIVNFPSGKVEGTLIDLDNLESTIVFSKDTKDIAEPAKFRMNEIQADGAQITYYRRYIWGLMLDICDEDEIDKNSAGAKEKQSAKTSKKPASAEERNEIKEELTNAEGQADELQIKALKNACKRLKELDPSQEEMIKKIAKKSKKFTSLSKESCEKLVLKLGEMITALEEGE